jgi:RNA polymerase sigma factor for flagellar operon FliA
MSADAGYLQAQRVPIDEMVKQHSVLVRRIAYHLMARLPASVEVGDLIQSGMIGLIEAARNYSPGRTANFETYAGIRIRGAMLDELRKSDWTPRSVHRKFREVCEAIREVEAETGSDAEDVQVATRLGISIDEYHSVLADAASCRVLSLSGSSDDGLDALDVADERDPGPAGTFDDSHQRAALVESIAQLPEREQLVMSLYYEQELNLKEIGEVIGVSESRVCQIHGQALVRLRSRLRDWRGT